MSENQVIAIMAAIIHTGAAGRIDDFSLNGSVKAAMALYDKATSMPSPWKRYMEDGPPTPFERK